MYYGILYKGSAFVSLVIDCIEKIFKLSPEGHGSMIKLQIVMLQNFLWAVLPGMSSCCKIYIVLCTNCVYNTQLHPHAACNLHSYTFEYTVLYHKDKNMRS